MSTAQSLAFLGARHIKKKAWLVGRVYIANYDVRDQGLTWCYIHPGAGPSRNPTPVLLRMLEGDDWEEIKDASDKQEPVPLHGGDSPRHEAEEEGTEQGPGQGVRGGAEELQGPAEEGEK